MSYSTNYRRLHTLWRIYTFLPGVVRKVNVSIGKSAYQPSNNPHQIKESLDLLLLKSRKIDDPFEQSFFILAHMSYLQAFEDVNKRTARLSSNIPFIKQNVSVRRTHLNTTSNQ